MGRPRRRWVDNIRMDLQEVGCGYMDWIGLAQDRDRWRTLVSAVMILRVPWNAGNFLTSCKPVSFSRRTLHRAVSKYRHWCIWLVLVQKYITMHGHMNVKSPVNLRGIFLRSHRTVSHWLYYNQVCIFIEISLFPFPISVTSFTSLPTHCRPFPMCPYSVSLPLFLTRISF